MPFRIEIPFTNTNDCLSFVKVEYKKDFQTAYTALTPNPTVSPIVIENLDGLSTYNFRITARCCNGQFSTISPITISTP